MDNLFFIIVAILSVIFIWLMWLRHGLVVLIQRTNQKKYIIQNDLWARRDMVPALLEGFRKEKEPTKDWHELLTDRAYFHTHTNIEQDLEYEKKLLHFVQENELNNLLYLETKNRIIKMTETIEQEKQEVEKAVIAYNELRNQFPYSLVSAIFRLQEIRV